MNFKPMLAPNKAVDLDTLDYPLWASYKIDGIRCIFKDGEMYTRSLKQFPNVQLVEKFKGIAAFCKKYDLILDGELYSPTMEFNDLSGLCRTLDKEIPKDLKFYCFDGVKDGNFNLKFSDRQLMNVVALVMTAIQDEPFVPVKHFVVDHAAHTRDCFTGALKDGYEGLILRSFDGKYKCGRCTIKEANMFKVKPYETFDAKIIDVVQATEVDPTAEKKTNELGRSITSKKKGDRIPIEKAAGFVVSHNGLDLTVVIAMTDEEKKEIWENRDSYIGKWIEYKGMLIGAKDLPRHPVMTRFREDKE